MSHKTIIGGTAYDVKGGKCLVNGTSYDIKKGRTLIGGTGYDITFAPPYDPVFANNTWEQIIRACHNAEVPETWNVADQKTMTIGGADYQIDIIGKNHDDYSDGSGKAPLTFQLHDCYGVKYKMNNSKTNTGGWAACDMRKTHLPNIRNQMPAEVRGGIREVNKKAADGGYLDSAVVVSADGLFVLSQIEIIGKGGSAAVKRDEGTQYAYYSNGGSTVKRFNSVPDEWWTRSPPWLSNVQFVYILKKGAAQSGDANLDKGVSFAFCF